MWFKMGLEIINCSVYRALEAPQKERDNLSAVRCLAFIHLLSWTAMGFADDLQHADDLSRFTSLSKPQALIVWEILQKHGVLQLAQNGYSCRQWMIERGFLGVQEKDKTQEQRSNYKRPKNVF